MSNRIWVLAALVGLGATSQAGEIARIATPAISPDGSEIAFSYQDDLWIVPTDGGAARRLTVHPAHDLMPHWTPDGQTIVFSSDRYGSYDVFAIDKNGDHLKRLTFDPARETVTSVSPDGKWVYGATTNWGRNGLFKVSINGGDLIKLAAHPLEQQFQATVTPDSKHVIFIGGAGSGSWRNPNNKGSNNGEIWSADNTVPLSNFKNLTHNDFNEFFPNVDRSGAITCISNRSGWPNVWRLDANGGRGKMLSKFTDGTMSYLTESADGSTIAFVHDSQLWTLHPGSVPTRIAVTAPDDVRLNPEHLLSLQTPNSFVLSPDGRKIIADLRGDLFLMADRGGATRRLTTDPAPDMQPQFLDDKTAIFTTARTGKREIWKTDLKGSQQVFLSDPTADVLMPVVSPDRKWIAFQSGSNKICVVDSAKALPAKTIAEGPYLEGFRGDQVFSWSPDGKFIVIAVPTDRGGTNIEVVAIDTLTHQTIAKLPRGCDRPEFLPNGKAVFFVAADGPRSDLYSVDLKPANVKFLEDELDKLDDAPKAAGDEEETPDQARRRVRPAGTAPAGTAAAPTAGPGLAAGRAKNVKVEIDVNGIDRRLVRLSTDGASQPFASADGSAIYARTAAGWQMYSTTTGAATPMTTLTGSIFNVIWNASGEKAFAIIDGKLSSLAATGAAAPIAFSAQAIVRDRDEQTALFNEIGWAMERLYYNPNLNGKDWRAIREKFGKIVPYVADRDDFYALMGEMMEELNSSHLGSTPPGPETPTTTSGESVGFLGLDWKPEALVNGQYVVDKVLIGSPADHPQSKLIPGDVVKKINDVALDQTHPSSSLLAQTIGKRVRLDIERNGKPMTISIKPTSFAARTSLAYADWVDRNRQTVETLSKGALTYLHYESMSEPSQEKFLREIRTLTPGRKGIIIDIRFNGGGSTAHEALGVLIKRQWLVRTRRDDPGKPRSENIYRGDSLELPSCLITNQYSFSNAEIFSEGFRRLGIGPIVGERTAGGCIGTSPYGLWDGGSIRMPAYGAYTVDGENLEGLGRRTDDNVLYDPNAFLEGRDTQLEAAVRDLLKRIH